MKERLRINSDEFEVRRSVRRKRISVGFDHEAGTYFIAAPEKFPSEDIRGILRPQMDLLMHKIISGKKEIAPSHKYESGEKFFLKGVEYPLKRVPGKTMEPLEFCSGVFYISENRSGRERETFDTWYRKALYEEIRRILPFWTKKIVVNPASINIKTVKSVWGSCSSKGNLTFSTRLALVPAYLLEYVVAHELCHLKHMDHSASFWEELSGHMDDCKDRRKKLREQEHLYRWW